MKDGIKTTEFWGSVGTVLSQLVTVLVVVGLVAAGDQATLVQALVAAATAIGGFVSNAAIVIKYVQGRVNLKQFTK